MRRRNIDVVCPAHQAIADVDDEGAGDDRRFDPLSGARADLEAADIVGRKQRQVAVIGVLTRAGGRGRGSGGAG